MERTIFKEKTRVKYKGRLGYIVGYSCFEEPMFLADESCADFHSGSILSSELCDVPEDRTYRCYFICTSYQWAQLEPVYEFGEEIEVEIQDEHWTTRSFLFMHEDVAYCLSRKTTLNPGRSGHIFGWKNHRKKQTTPVLNINITLNGESVDPSTLSKESLKKLGFQVD